MDTGARKDIFSQCTAYTEGFIIRVGANEEQRVFSHILDRVND
jgi:hypothetical protein